MALTRRAFMGGIAGTVAVGGIAAQAPVARAAGDRRPKHVILIDWDGFDPRYLGRVPTPNLAGLAAGGSLSIAESTFHTMSNPVRSSMATGAFPEVHGNVAYVYDPDTDTVQGQVRDLEAETIAQALARQGRTIASVQWYIVEDYGTAYGDPEHLYVQPGGTVDRRVDVAIDILNLRPVDSNGEPVTVPRIPDFLAVYSSDLDSLGHDEGPDSVNIAAALAEHDRQLGRLVEATKDVGIFEETAFLLASDHGMTGWNRTVIPDALDVIEDLGYTAEAVSSGASPAPETEVIISPSFIRIADITLRGGAEGKVPRQRIAAALRELRQVDRMLDAGDLRRLHAGDKLGDLVAEAKPPWGFAMSVPPAGEWRGSHGSLREMRVPLFLAGAGIARGRRPRHPRLIDLAPTIAALLGAEPPADAQGRVLDESLAMWTVSGDAADLGPSS